MSEKNKKEELIINRETRYLCPHVGDECPFAKKIIKDGINEWLIYSTPEDISLRVHKLLKKLEKEK